jgi:hypothetical protein
MAVGIDDHPIRANVLNAILFINKPLTASKTNPDRAVLLDRGILRSLAEKRYAITS